MHLTPSGWPSRIDPETAAQRVAAGVWTGRTIADSARELAAREPGRILFGTEEDDVAVGPLVERAEALARGLLELGVAPGQTVSLQMPNWIEVAEIDLACAMGGFVVNPIVPIYREAELRQILADARTRLIFAPARYRNTDHVALIESLRGDLPLLAHVIPVREGSAYEDLIARGRASTRALPRVDPDDVKSLVYTSGTTGAAKGVIYTHNQARRTLANTFRAWDLPADMSVLIGTPIGHVTGFSFGIDIACHFGSRTQLMEAWNAARAVELIDGLGITAMIGATPFLFELIQAAQAAKTTLPSLVFFLCGGAAVPADLVARAYEAFPDCVTFRAFGSTECPLITQGVRGDPVRCGATDGRVDDYEVKVVDEASRILPPGEEGEILARGPAMFVGYTDPKATEEAFDAEGYFRTGDLVRMSEDGVITVTGRKKDLIIRGGENLSAKEIEDALHAHPAVAEAAVFSMPHARLGEGVCAWIIPAGEARPDRAELAVWLKARGLAPQKWPERVDHVEALPKTPSGKVQKHILRRLIAERMADEARAAS